MGEGGKKISLSIFSTPCILLYPSILSVLSHPFAPPEILKEDDNIIHSSSMAKAMSENISRGYKNIHLHFCTLKHAHFFSCQWYIFKYGKLFYISATQMNTTLKLQGRSLYSE